MALPEEDRGPAWLRNWEHIEADIQAMDDFAKKLRAEVETNYVSHLSPILDSATTQLPAVDPRFGELLDLFDTHRTAQETSTHQVRDYANRSAGMAEAASKISSNYGESDAFAHASVTKVNEALGATGVAAPGAGGANAGGANAGGAGGAGSGGAGASGAGASGAGAPGAGSEGGVTIPISEGY